MRAGNPENRVLIARRKIRYLLCVHTKETTLSMHGKMDRILLPFPSAPIRVAEYPREIRSGNESGLRFACDVNQCDTDIDNLFDLEIFPFALNDFVIDNLFHSCSVLQTTTLRVPLISDE